MTTERTIVHNPMHTTEPLALKSNEGLGPLPEATRCLGLHFGERTWWRADAEGAHGEGVYSAGEVVVYTLGEVQRAVAAERERCAAVCEGVREAADHAARDGHRKAGAMASAALCAKLIRA